MTESDPLVRRIRVVRKTVTAALICSAMAASACTSGARGGDIPSVSARVTTILDQNRTPVSVPATTTQGEQRTLPPQTVIAAPPHGNQLVGVWRSVKDPTDVRTFDTDGTATDQVGTSPYIVTTRKRWAWVTHASAVGGPPVTDLVLRLSGMDAPAPLGLSGVYFYSVDFDDPDTLELMYLEGPGEQYTRVR